jgi:hypothetical protein
MTKAEWRGGWLMGREGVAWILNLIEWQNNCLTRILASARLRHGHGQGSSYLKRAHSRPRPGPGSDFGAGRLCAAPYPL